MDHPDANPTEECAACCDTKSFFELQQAPCGHHYCHQCFAQLFQVGLTGQQFFPPKCCGMPIVLSHAHFCLPHDLAEEYEAKCEELSTKNRTYCHDPKCTTFISPTLVRDKAATCPACKKVTCTTCKGAIHVGDCPKDEGLQSVKILANNSRCQQCYQCQHMIEIKGGCNHITCLCGAELCYNCGAKWKTCGCVYVSEELMNDREAGIIHQDPTYRLFRPGVDVADQTHTEVNGIYQPAHLYHACEVHAFEHLLGHYYCQLCGESLWHFIFDCSRCHLKVCKRCKNNLA